MSALDQAVNDYLALRRGLGFKLEMHGRVLTQFAEFLEQREATLISTALALEFGEPDVTNTAGTSNTTKITPVNASVGCPRNSTNF